MVELMSMSRRVASICISNEASWIAVTTTLAVNVVYVAIIWKRTSCSCAFNDSVVRRFRPKTSGTYETLTWGVKRLYRKALELSVGAICPDCRWREAEKLPETLGK